MVEKVGKIISNENGVKIIKNVYTDTIREYSKSSGVKKKSILDTYSEAAQRNILLNALVSIADELAIDNEAITKLKELKSFIDSI